MRKLNNILVITGGIILLTFGLFHLAFWKVFDWENELFKLDQANSNIMQMLNIGTICFLLSSGLIMLFYRSDMLHTRLGNVFSLNFSLFFMVRLISEFVFPESSIVFAFILFLCTLIFLIPVLNIKSMVTTLREVPELSIISNGFGRIDYVDSYRISKNTDDSIDKITTEVFRTSRLGNLLMNLRDAIVKVFGLKTSDTGLSHEADYYPVGSVAMAFHVIDRNEKEIVMGEKDKHLDFRVSVLKDSATSHIYVTTIVRFNHWSGKLYFLPVKPFHCVLIKNSIKRLIK